LPTPAIIIFITNLPIRKISIELSYIISKCFPFGNQLLAKLLLPPGFFGTIKKKEGST